MPKFPILKGILQLTTLNKNINKSIKSKGFRSLQNTQIFKIT